jgi:hypothetical protein
MSSLFFLTLGGRVLCQQCSALSKRTRQQCRAPALKGKTKCRFHGGKSTGPKTLEGRVRCASAKTKTGLETRQNRAERSRRLAYLRELEAYAYENGQMIGPRTRGRPPRPKP